MEISIKIISNTIVNSVKLNTKIIQKQNNGGKMKKYIFVAGLLATTTQIQALDLNKLAGDWLNKQLKTEQSVPTQNNPVVATDENVNNNQNEISDDELKIWRDANFYNDDEIKEWISLGFTSPEMTRIWTNPSDDNEARSYNIEDVKKLFAINITTREQVDLLVKALPSFFTLHEIEKIGRFYKGKKDVANLYLAGNKDIEQLQKKYNIEYSQQYQDSLYHWINSGIDSVDEAKSSIESGISADTFESLKRIGLKLNDIKQLKTYQKQSKNINDGKFVADIILWKENKYDLSEFDSWYSLFENIQSSFIGFEDIITWKKNNISIEEAKEWINAGYIMFSDYEIVVNKGIKSPKEAKRWNDVGVNLTNDVYQRWLALGLDTPEKILPWTKVFPNILHKEISKHLDGLRSVENSIKSGYTTPDSVKAFQVKEEKERLNAQKPCDTWRKKAHKMTYSLGVGDKVVSKNGGKYVILEVHANTFLVQGLGMNTFIQKSESIPYSELVNVPNKYCLK
jgi:hypothetical protein